MAEHALHIVLALGTPVVIILGFLAYDRHVEKRDARRELEDIEAP